MTIVALAGGTGGAKLAHGLQLALPRDTLDVVVNTGDDTERHGLLVMPDHDAVFYMLDGRFDHERGWGIADESWTVMDELERYGEDAWFRLGDRDFATHIARASRLRDGASLTDACLALQTTRELPSRVLPMTDESVRTEVRTDEGWLEFQEYFVHRHHAPDVHEVRYDGVEIAQTTPNVKAAFAAAKAVIIGPSNPLLSLGPILAVPGMLDLIRAARSRRIPVVAVSGIIGGVALKGPADRILASLGFESSALTIAERYASWLDGFVLDDADAGLEPSVAALGLRTLVTNTIMEDEAGRERLARSVLGFCGAA